MPLVVKSAHGWLKLLEDEKRGIAPKVPLAEKPLSCFGCSRPQSECAIFIECEFPGNSLAAKDAGVAPAKFRSGFCSACWRFK